MAPEKGDTGVAAAGRIDAATGVEYASQNIKPGDLVNVGMHRTRTT